MPKSNHLSPQDEPLRVALVQMTSTDDWSENLASIKRLLARSPEIQQSELVLLPENALCFGASAMRKLAESPEPMLYALADIAQQYGITLVAGSLPMLTRADGSRTDGRLRSASIVFGPQGERVARYDKVHLFDVDVDDAQGGYRESDTFEPGQQVNTFSVNGWCCGMSICYDLRFPELYAKLRAQGSEVVCVPSAFTAVTGEAHWEYLLRARAIETQSYVLAANQWGQHTPQRRTWGHSMVVDPWGRIIARCKEGEQVITASLERAVIAKVRRDMPVCSHRRL